MDATTIVNDVSLSFALLLTTKLDTLWIVLGAAIASITATALGVVSLGSP